MSRDRRLTTKRLDKMSERVHARLKREGIEHATTLCVGMDARIGNHEATRVGESVRNCQRLHDEKLGERIPIVLIIEVVGRAGTLNRRQESAVGLVIMHVAEWCYEIHYPTGDTRKPLMALRNVGWKREGEIPAVEWSLLERDFFREGEQLVPEGVTSHKAAWELLVKRCPKLRPIEHVDARAAQRWAERSGK